MNTDTTTNQTTYDTAFQVRRRRGTAPAEQLALPMFVGGKRENDP